MLKELTEEQLDELVKRHAKLYSEVCKDNDSDLVILITKKEFDKMKKDLNTVNNETNAITARSTLYNKLFSLFEVLLIIGIVSILFILIFGALK